ncbi:hypothetical protein [Clostridium algidicarnis]|uniref:hypothetical protein n=1 Tax=Clostridium algidicarnis TaxID=37659 RepID=UPI00049531BB|nr:hypothetical protein [Clostridium algidicarnis]
MEKYYVIKNKYLAEGLAFLGFRYFKYNQNGKETYSFIKNEDFLNAMQSIIKLKNEIGYKNN